MTRMSDDLLPRCGRCGVVCVEEADGQPCGEGVWSSADVRLGDCGGVVSWRATAVVFADELARLRDARADTGQRQDRALAEVHARPGPDERGLAS